MFHWEHVRENSAANGNTQMNAYSFAHIRTHTVTLRVFQTFSRQQRQQPAISKNLRVQAEDSPVLSTFQKAFLLRQSRWRGQIADLSRLSEDLSLACETIPVHLDSTLSTMPTKASQFGVLSAHHKPSKYCREYRWCVTSKQQQDLLHLVYSFLCVLFFLCFPARSGKLDQTSVEKTRRLFLRPSIDRLILYPRAFQQHNAMTTTKPPLSTKTYRALSHSRSILKPWT